MRMRAVHYLQHLHLIGHDAPPLLICVFFGFRDVRIGLFDGPAQHVVLSAISMSQHQSTELGNPRRLHANLSTLRPASGLEHVVELS